MSCNVSYRVASVVPLHGKILYTVKVCHDMHLTTMYIMYNVLRTPHHHRKLELYLFSCNWLSIKRYPRKFMLIFYHYHCWVRFLRLELSYQKTMSKSVNRSCQQIDRLETLRIECRLLGKTESEMWSVPDRRWKMREFRRGENW